GTPPVAITRQATIRRTDEITIAVVKRAGDVTARRRHIEHHAPIVVISPDRAGRILLRAGFESNDELLDKFGMVIFFRRRASNGDSQ
ncbi:MAG: hypothetical protein R3284_05000, partial [Rubricoccaceae bacterium]|nr:hypothetical protein [Rubricoccaceae bacterium]